MKNFTFNKIAFLSSIAFLVSSCASLTSISYTDDVYFDPSTSNEQSAKVNTKKDKKEISEDQKILDEYIANGNFYNDDYDDYNYADRLQRFHNDNYQGDYYPRNHFGMSFGFGYPYGNSWGMSYGFGYPYYGYYDPFYYDAWYDPFYSWHNPYYSPWFSPYYSYYSPYYYGYNSYPNYGYETGVSVGSGHRPGISTGSGINKYEDDGNGTFTGSSIRSGRSNLNTIGRSNQAKIPTATMNPRPQAVGSPVGTRPVSNASLLKDKPNTIDNKPMAVDRASVKVPVSSSRPSSGNRPSSGTKPGSSTAQPNVNPADYKPTYSTINTSTRSKSDNSSGYTPSYTRPKQTTSNYNSQTRTNSSSSRSPQKYSTSTTSKSNSTYTGNSNSNSSNSGNSVRPSSSNSNYSGSTRSTTRSSTYSQPRSSSSSSSPSSSPRSSGSSSGSSSSSRQSSGGHRR